MKAILLNKKVDREKRRDESIKVGKDGEVRETEIRKKERKIHVGRKMKELNVKGSQGNTARSSRE